MTNVHIQRPTDTPLYTGLFDFTKMLEEKFNMKNKTMIEIGSYQGESTEVFAQTFGKIYAVDPWQNGYDPSDHSSYVTEMSLVEKAFDARMSKYSGIVKIKDTSSNFLSKFEGIVDFVYIDGNHQYESIIQDLRLSSKVSRYIGGHDWGMPGLAKALQEFLNVERVEDIKDVAIFNDSSWILTTKMV